MKSEVDFKLSVAVSGNLQESYPSIFRGDWIQNLLSAKKFGFDAIEIHTGNPLDFPWQAMLKACKDNSMEISSISTGLSYSTQGLNVLAEDNAIKKRARIRFREYVDLAKRLDSSLIVGLMRGLVPSNNTVEEYQEKFADYMSELLSYAEDNEVTLVLEAINRFENNFLLTSKDVVDFIRPFNSPFLKILLDSYHMNIEESDLVDAIYTAKGVIGYFHASDSNRMVPGYGHIDFKSIIRALWKSKYKGFLSVEALPVPNPEVAAMQCSSLLKNIINVIKYEVQND